QCCHTVYFIDADIECVTSDPASPAGLQERRGLPAQPRPRQLDGAPAEPLAVHREHHDLAVSRLPRAGDELTAGSAALVRPRSAPAEPGFVDRDVLLRL